MSVPAGATRFTFQHRVPVGAENPVQIVSAPPGQLCRITQRLGPFLGDLSDVAVTCNAPGTFTLAATMNGAHDFGHTATLLKNGEVLIAGGATAVAELYDPATDTFSVTGTMVSARQRHTATLLANGKVLLAGGWIDGYSIVTATAELYDPASGTFTSTGNMVTPRGSHSATLLADGKVLIAGGKNTTAEQYPVTAELYDETTGVFTLTGSLSGLSFLHTATLLKNGKVLIAGGDGTNRAQLYDPATGSFGPTGSMVEVRGGPQATLLMNGLVLVIGGQGPPYGDALATAELYDPDDGVFRSTGEMIGCHWAATLLSNGMVLVVGTTATLLCYGADPRFNSELYDPQAGTFDFTLDPVLGRETTVRPTLLPNGKVLLTGGVIVVPEGIPAKLATAELFSLP